MSQSVRRAARIIDTLAVSPQAVVSLAADFGLHRTTMFRELKTLEEVGYVRRRADGSYTLGMRLVALGQLALSQVDLRGAAAMPIRRLHQSTGDSVHVAALVGDEIVYVDRVEDESEVRMPSSIGAQVQPHCTGIGKAILAWLTGAQREAVLSRVARHTAAARAGTDRVKLESELARISSRGWACDDGESNEIIASLAVPILSSAGVVGGLSVTSIRMVRGLEELHEHLPQLRRTAEEIGRELG